MNPLLTLSEINENNRQTTGGKAAAVAKMASCGLTVPLSVCITTDAFECFMEQQEMRNRIMMEYYRKDFDDMRWEEIWDLSLRIKNMFLRAPYPPELESALRPELEKQFNNRPVVVRSSAPGEDSAERSFAGIHESYVNIRGLDALLAHIKLVWASLFSDAAILYRKETGLDVQSSAMAVLVQEFINGQQSGVVFGRSPNSEKQMMIEAVHGLNQGLVDGTVAPDRWILSRKSGRIHTSTSAEKKTTVVASEDGITTADISGETAVQAPLTEKQVHEVYLLCKTLEELFGAPQDVEWTYRNTTLYALQSRPITTGKTDDKDDVRAWYASLKRSLADLKQLRLEIEEHHIPRMEEAARTMERAALADLPDSRLADELEQRAQTYSRWHAVYWDKFIPFAHGFRLFGELYNRQLQPEDPYEFTQALLGTGMKSMERNRMLEKLAHLYPLLHAGNKTNDENAAGQAKEFERQLDAFLEKYENPAWGLGSSAKEKESLRTLLKEMRLSGCKQPNARRQNNRRLQKQFIDSFPEAERSFAEELIDLARASYRLRDDDNIYLGKIETQRERAMNEAKTRIEAHLDMNCGHLSTEEAVKALKQPGYRPVVKQEKKEKKVRDTARPRQLIGQPAGEGLVTAPARVIKDRNDIVSFKAGELLVCDAIDPNMTFIVPMASGIVERRGGMLIHGAIIAREYGLPCITGVPDAIDLIENGTTITVDGYLGIVTIHHDDK